MSAKKKRQYRRRGQSGPDISLEIDIRRRIASLQDDMIKDITDAARKKWRGEMPKWAIVEIMRDMRAKWYPRFKALGKEIGDVLAEKADARTRRQILGKLHEYGLEINPATWEPADEAIKLFKEQNEKTIKAAAMSACAKAEATLSAAFDAGRTEAEMTDRMTGVKVWCDVRAELIAKNSSNQATQLLALANAKSCGIQKGRWIHVPGHFSSRKTHIEFDRKEFDLAEGMYDEDVKKFVHPGELPYCNCQFQVIVPGFND